MLHAIIIPITINNSWKFLRYGKFPLGIGVHLNFTVHSSFKVSDYNVDELIAKTEKQITDAIIYDK